MSAAQMPVLPALLHPLAERLLMRHTDWLKDLADGLGSPLHVVLPQLFAFNAQCFNESVRAAGVDGLVLYARKANKARCFTEACPRLGLGVDAASLEEATQALGAGVPGRTIGISGPAKHPELLRLALWQGCLLAVDSLQELQQVAAIALQQQRSARLLLRWRPPSQAKSRFGLADDELRHALQLCAAQPRQLAFEGFSFHLGGYSPEERAEAAHWLVDLSLDARRLGLHADSIDIGGGFGVRYVEPAAWNDFQAQQDPQHYHAARRFGGGFYPYAAESHGPAMLAELLALPQAGQGPSLAERLRRDGMRLLLEPGRALLDQAGFTLYRVQGVKDRPGEGYGIVTVAGTSFSLSEQWFDSEYLPDPLLLGAAPASGRPEPYAACVGGSTCLDSDMVSWRKLRLPRRPAPGDLLAYLNTAGYQMDSNESPFHDLPLPHKVVVQLDEHQRPHWRLDSIAPAAWVGAATGE